MTWLYVLVTDEHLETTGSTPLPGLCAFVQLTSPTDKLSDAQRFLCYHQQSGFGLWKWLTPKENIEHKEVNQGASFHLNVTGSILSAPDNQTNKDHSTQKEE